MFIENKHMFYENMFKKEICFAYCLIHDCEAMLSPSLDH